MVRDSDDPITWILFIICKGQIRKTPSYYFLGKKEEKKKKGKHDKNVRTF